MIFPADLVLFALAGVWVSGMDGYVIVGPSPPTPSPTPSQGSGGAGRCLDAELQPLSLDDCCTRAGSGDVPAADRRGAKLDKGGWRSCSPPWPSPASS